MRFLIGFITITLLAGLSVDAEAQILNRLKKKAQEAAEKKAEEKLTEQVQRAAEQAVERSWNSIFGEWEADSSSGELRIPFTMSSNVTTEDEYRFQTVTTMEIQSRDKEGNTEPPVTMAMHFNDEAMYTGTKFTSEETKQEEGELFIIYDLNNSAMLMLMESEDNKFSFAYAWDQHLTDADSTSEEEVNWDELEEWRGYEKIGSRTILGYACEGYRAENEEETTEVWVTRDEELGMTNLFKANANTKQMRGKIPEDYPYGMMMEMTTDNHSTGEQITMRVTNIKKGVNIAYAMADYPPMSFGKTAKN